LLQILTVFLVSCAFFIGTAFDQYGNSLLAQAEPVTPEATQYQVDKPQNPVNNVKDAAQQASKSSQDKGKNFLENIREKLNLDEPLDPGTKEVIKDASEAITGQGD
jgi:hypothetical protein